MRQMKDLSNRLTYTPQDEKSTFCIFCNQHGNLIMFEEAFRKYTR